jgi:hypothetical protein
MEVAEPDYLAQLLNGPADFGSLDLIDAHSFAADGELYPGYLITQNFCPRILLGPNSACLVEINAWLISSNQHLFGYMSPSRLQWYLV